MCWLKFPFQHAPDSTAPSSRRPGVSFPLPFTCIEFHAEFISVPQTRTAPFSAPLSPFLGKKDNRFRFTHTGERWQAEEPSVLLPEHVLSLVTEGRENALLTASKSPMVSEAFLCFRLIVSSGAQVLGHR